MTQTLADLDSTRKRRAIYRLFQSLGYESLVSQYCTKSEERWRKNKVQIDVAQCKLLKPNEENGVLKLL